MIKTYDEVVSFSRWCLVVIYYDSSDFDEEYSNDMDMKIGSLVAELWHFSKHHMGMLPSQRRV